MNTELQTLALEYATLVQEYYELEVHCSTSTLREDTLKLRRKQDEMLYHHHLMTSLARELAEQVML